MSFSSETSGAGKWMYLPEHVAIQIFRGLNLRDASSAARTCKLWSQHFHSPSLWRHVEFNFYRGFDRDKSQLSLIDQVGVHVRSLVIRLDQSDLENRLLATEALKNFGNNLVGERQVQRLKVECTGENPLFYKGQEFVEALGLFASADSVAKLITHLDLACLPIAITNELLYSFSKHFSSLQYLDIQNKQLICQVSPDCMETVVKGCPQLCDLRLFHASLSNAVLEGFCSESRQMQLKHLSIMCRRQEKYRQDDLSQDIWHLVTIANPSLRVTLKFDHTCPLWKVREIMKPQIPVANLFLETYTMIYPELEMATDSYSDTLQKVVIQTQPSEELDYALLEMSRKCGKLASLHVMCTVDKETIRTILTMHPQMQKKRSYTLKNEMEPCPWVAVTVLDEIRTDW